MSWGIETRNSSGIVTFNSTLDHPVFSRKDVPVPLGTNLDISVDTQPSGSSAFLFPTDAIGIVTPDDADWVNTPVVVTTVGGVSPEGIVKPPEFISTLQGRDPNYSIKPSVVQADSVIKVTNSEYNYISGDAYGIRINGSDLYNNFGMYVVVKKSDGSYIRNSTAQSLSKDSNLAFRVDSGSLPMNITFDSPLHKPPLIFITSSDDYVSFAGFVKNTQGLYIGAKVLCQPERTSSGYLYYRISRTVPFSYYYAASAEEFYEDGSFGIDIKTQGGTLVFSVPKYSPVKTIRSNLVDKSYTYMKYDNNNFSIVTTAPLQYSKTQFPPPGAICLNNINAFEGMYWYTLINQQGTMLGIRGVSGTGVKVDNDNITISSFPVIEGFGYTITIWAASWHTTLGINSQTNYLFSYGEY